MCVALAVLQVNLSLIQKLLPEELLLKVFTALPVTSLAAAQCVCRQWRGVGAAPPLWAAACAEVFHDRDAAGNAALVKEQYGGSWKTMFLDRGHLRFDGVYVSRNTYLRTGMVNWDTKNPVHLVCYYRYQVFLPNGEGVGAAVARAAVARAAVAAGPCLGTDRLFGVPT